jgi:tetratricopeptide (TPR) repeat protein
MRLRLSAIQFWGVTTVLTAVLVTPPVFAQGGKKKPNAEQNETDTEARRLFKEGDKQYAEGDYEGAVRAFEKAYELSKQPALKYNLANAYERLARYEAALDALKSYEPHAPADQREVIKRRIGKLQERVEQQDAERAKSQSMTSEQPPAEPGQVGSPASPEEPEPPAASLSTESPTPMLGYVLIGVGAIGIGAGAVFGIQALGSKSDAEELCVENAGARRCPASASDSLSSNTRSAVIADVSIGVGLVAAAIGTYFVIKSKSAESATSAQVRAGAGPRGGSLSLVGTF